MDMSSVAASNRRYLSLGFFLLICLAAASAGSLATYPTLEDWYDGLNRPHWTPSAGVFGPVWTALSTLLAIAAWLVWDRVHGGGFPALKLLGYQLGLNVLWSIVFFGLRDPDTAAAGIVVLWFLTGATTLSFFRIHRLAGTLLIPYWGWVTFTAALNFAIAQ